MTSFQRWEVQSPIPTIFILSDIKKEQRKIQNCIITHVVGQFSNIGKYELTYLQI